MRFGGKRPGISFPLSYLARENKRVDILRNLTIVLQSTWKILSWKGLFFPGEELRKGGKIFGKFVCSPSCWLTSVLCLHFSAISFHLSPADWPQYFVVKASFWHGSLLFQLHLSFLFGLWFPAAPLLSLFALFCPLVLCRAEELRHLPCISKAQNKTRNAK